MIAKGHVVHASAPELTGDIAEQVRKLGAIPHDIALQRTGTGISGDIAYFRGLRDLIKDIKPDRVIGYTIKPNIWGSLAAKSCGVKSAAMVTGLGYAFIEGEGWKRRIVGTVSRTLYRMATSANDVVIFQNPDDRDDFVAAGALSDPDKVRFVNGSGVDMAHYARAALPDSPVFLMIGRLLGSKGVREYAEAALRLKKQHPDWTFRIGGFFDGGPDSIAADELDSWINGGIEYLGELKDVRPAISAASVYVLPSYREGTPRSVLEAMAMGRAIVTTDAPGCRETVRHADNGYLVPVRNVDQLAEAMEKLGLDADLRAEMGARSFAIAQDKYAVERVNATLMQHLGL